MTPKPWNDEPRDENLVAFGELTAAQQEAVTGAVQAAIDMIAGPNPERAASLQLVAMRAMPSVLRHAVTGEVSIGVEFPRFPPDFDRGKLGEADRMTFGNSEVRLAAARAGNEADNLFTMGVRRPVALREALELLTSDGSPERELAARRKQVAVRIAAEKEAAARAVAKETEFTRQQEAWRRRNATQLERWERASRLAQILATAAESYSTLREFAALVLELETSSRPLRLPAWLEAPERDELPAWAQPRAR